MLEIPRPSPACPCPKPGSGHPLQLAQRGVLRAEPSLIFSLSPFVHTRSSGSRRAVPTGCTGTCWRSWVLRRLLRTRLQWLRRRGRGLLCWAQVSQGQDKDTVSEQRRSRRNAALSGPRAGIRSVPLRRLRPPMPVSPALPSWDWKPVDGLCSLPYLQPEPQRNEEPGYLTQAEWWELLFFIKKLDVCEQQPIFQRLRENLDEVL